MKRKKFIDRTKELDFLEREYRKEESSLVILYGRRRTGKTALLSEFIKNKDGLYYLVTQESEAMNYKNFVQAVEDYTQTEGKVQEQMDCTTWQEVFSYILQCKKKPLIVIDEFQYLGKSNEAFPSIFQKIWDTLLKESNVMVVLCGSLISMMISQTLNYNSPLYGRRTGQIKLKQIPFVYYKDFMTNRTYEEQIERYAVTGGIPKYIELFTDDEDIYQAIEKNILDSSMFLYNEPEFLLQNEVKDVGSYFSIIKVIAAGAHKLGEIASQLETNQTQLTYYLKTLIDLDILEREVPVTEKNPEKSKKGLYQIKDNYIWFWFKFVYPYRGQLEIGNAENVKKRIQNNFIDNHVSFVYEDICREKLMHSDLNLLQVGRYWDKNTEIDVVGINEEEKRIVFGECKYWKEAVGLNVLEKLQEKSKKVSWNKDNREEIFVVFSIHGFSQELLDYARDREDVLLIR